MKLMNDDMLDAVSGGTGEKVCMEEYDPINDAAKMQEFTTAWNLEGFPEMGRTRHEREELFMRWKSEGYRPDARAFLIVYK